MTRYDDNFHTEGNWEYDPESGVIFVGEEILFTVEGADDEDAFVAAAAPEMLKALKFVLEQWNAPTYGDHEALIDHMFDAIEMANTAIAKAIRRTS